MTSSFFAPFLTLKSLTVRSTKEKSMSRLLVFVPFLLALAIAGCTEAPASEPAKAASTPVVLATPAPAATPVPEALEIAGDLKPAQSAELSFKVGGHLASVAIARGAQVKKGDVLATLSDAEARAQLAQAEAGLAAAEAQAAIAKDGAERVAALAKDNAAPGNQVVTAKLSAEAAAAGVLAAKAQLALAQANVANHVLRAPFDGRIVRVPDGVGGTVGPGMPIARIEKLDVLVVQGTIGEADLDRVQVGDEAAVKTSNREAIGRVRSIVRSLEPMSRRAPIEIEVPNPDGDLVAGAYVRARIRTRVAAR